MRRRAIAIVVTLALIAAGGSLCVHAWKVWHQPVGSSATLTAEGIQIEDQGKDLDAAGERYEAALAADEDPTNSEILINIGTALLVLDRNDEAVVWLKRATTVAPDSAAAHNNLGVALAKINLWDESAAEFQRTLEIKPDHRTAGRSLLMVRQQIPAKTR